MVLLGDVLFTDDLIDLMYMKRDKYKYHFYGTSHEIFGFTFTDNTRIEEALLAVLENALYNNGRGKLWELYYCLNNKPLPDSGRGYTGEFDMLHYTYILDGSLDFDTMEQYEIWLKKNPLKKTEKGV